MATLEELQFTARAKTHIDMCNVQSKDAPAEDVALSAMYAPARYSAYVCKRVNPTKARMSEGRNEAIAMFDAQFRQMFIDCYDEFLRDYDQTT